MFDKLFDLPAHPLLIHAPIVLLPIAAIATVTLVAKPTWRARTSWWMVGALFVTLVLLFGAKESGEAFNEGFEVAFGGVGADKHESLANTTFLLTLAWFVVYAALTGYEYAQRRSTAETVETVETVDGNGAAAGNPVVSSALGGIAAVLAILATIWLIRTGHEGARITWGPVVDQLFPDS